MFLGKVVLEISSKCTGEHPCRSANSIKFLCNFIEITLWHGCSPVNLLHIFRTPFLKNGSGGLRLSWLLSISFYIHVSHCVKSVRIRSFSGPLFPGFRLEYEEILRISPYSVQMWEKTDQNSSEYGHSLLSECFLSIFHLGWSCS